MIQHKILTIDQLRQDVEARPELENMARFYCTDLKIPAEIHKLNLLCSIIEKETDWVNNIPRFEPAYGPGGLLYKRSKVLQSEYLKWGPLVSCSYGPAQIMYIVAKELGYSGHPLHLWSGEVSLPYAVAYINKLVNQFNAKTIEQIAAGYNGGPGVISKPDKWPKGYIARFAAIYDRLLNRYTGGAYV